MLDHDLVIGYNVSKSSSSSQDAQAFNPARGLAAIADGTSNSFLPEIWAKLLVDAFCHMTTQELENLFALEDVDEWLGPIQERWLSEVQEIVTEQDVEPEISNRLPLKHPAAATFVGVQFGAQSAASRWRALIVGDSTLMQVRNGKLVRSYAYTKSEQFGQFTETLASYPGKSKQPEFFQGERQPGDQFILATDAISKWLLQLHELNPQTFEKTFNVLHGLADSIQFEVFVRQQRQDRNIQLELDDTSIVMISPKLVEQPTPYAVPQPRSILDQIIERWHHIWGKSPRWSVRAGLAVASILIMAILAAGVFLRQNGATSGIKPSETLLAPGKRITPAVTTLRVPASAAAPIAITANPATSRAKTVTPVASIATSPTISRTTTATATINIITTKTGFP